MDRLRALLGADVDETPRSKANEVGNAIATALTLNASNTAGLSRGVGTHGETGSVVADVPSALRQTMDNARDYTWAEIVMKNGGEVVTMPIGTGNTGVKLASLAGMATAKVWATASERPTEDVADFTADTGTATDMGFPGNVHCLGSECTVTDGKLVGSQYFAQTAAIAVVHCVSNTSNAERDATPYVPEDLYAMYGHWLVMDVGTGAATVNTIATGTGAGTQGADLATNEDLASEAFYSGDAIGVSVLKKGLGDSATTESGRFTASIMLNASFEVAPTVIGTINNFKGGAVNSAWSVRLGEATLATTTGGNTGTAVTGGRDGSWNAQAYGTNVAKRPAGIFGGFSAHFADGGAAGAYATTKD